MNTQSKVALVRCENYEIENVIQAVRRGIDLLGGLEKFAQPGEKILLKPNLLAGRTPDRAVTTHPAVFEAIAVILRENGALVSFGDSPAISSPRVAAQKSGLWAVAEKHQIQLADFETGQPVSFPAGNLVKQFNLATGVLQADKIFSLPKLKTHGLTRFTGAIKNQFGCIPGVAKAEFHLKFPAAEPFSRMLVDLTRLVRPAFYLMDGIVAMEGNGPGNGNPVQLSVLLFATDPVALDATVARMVGAAPQSVPTTDWGERAELGTSRPEWVGDPLDSFIKTDFDFNRGPLSVKHHRFSDLLKNHIVAKPIIRAANCTRCGNCVSVCPAVPKAIGFSSSRKTEPPVYDYTRCIRCYCCQEVCPSNAIFLHTPWLGQIIKKTR